MDLSRATWRKSTRSGSTGNCIEVANLALKVAVRDSKDQRGPVLVFTPDQWDGFVRGVRASKFVA